MSRFVKWHRLGKDVDLIVMPMRDGRAKTVQNAFLTSGGVCAHATRMIVRCCNAVKEVNSVGNSGTDFPLGGLL